VITYEKLAKNPRLFQTFTGLRLEAFAQILPSFSDCYEADLAERDEAREESRQRERGGGRISAIPSMADKLVFILFYFRHYPMQTLQGFLFNMSQPQANDWIHRLTLSLNEALGMEHQLPARASTDIEKLLQACPELEFMLDGTERRVRRPQNSAQQKAKYSGKKKAHTVKNNVITEKKTGKIKGLSPTVDGKVHDKKLADEQNLIFPENSRLWQDTGFQGYAPSGVTIIQPKKKPRGGDLTLEQRTQNTAISKQRISVEHSIGGIKVFGIVGQVFRNVKASFDDLVMETACGLHNLRRDFPIMT
jgi:IS5 family transposase